MSLSDVQTYTSNYIAASLPKRSYMKVKKNIIEGLQFDVYHQTGTIRFPQKLLDGQTDGNFEL